MQLIYIILKRELVYDDDKCVIIGRLSLIQFVLDFTHAELQGLASIRLVESGFETGLTVKPNPDLIIEYR